MLIPFFIQMSGSYYVSWQFFQLGSTEAERSFSCLRQIHTWLQTTMTSDRLGNLGVIGMQRFNYEISIEKCCEQFKLRNPRKKLVIQFFSID